MKKKSKIDIIFEKIPPLISWSLITLPIFGGLLFPNFTAVVVVFFNLYFLYKSFASAICAICSFYNIKKATSINWLTRLDQIDNPNKYIEDLENRIKLIEKEGFKTSSSNDLLNTIINKRLPLFVRKILFKRSKRKAISFLENEIKNIQKLKGIKIKCDWKELRHVIIIPHWKEPYNVLKETLERIKKSNYPTKNIFICLAAEARDAEGIEKSYKLEKEYEEYFGGFLVTKHEMQEGDLIGKSSNMAHASKELDAKIAKLGWDLKKTTVTSCDADSQLPPDYFSNLAYFYIIDSKSHYKYYTGAVQFYANIWDLPFYARVKNSMSTVFNVGRLVRTDKLIPFSTYTTSFWLIKQIGFWSADIIPEDFHTYFKGLFKYPDEVMAIPIFQPILSDAAEGDGNIDTIKNNYFQERRWSWGISDDGWVLKTLIKKIIEGKANLRLIYIALHTMFDHVSGVGVAFLVSLGGIIPLLINPQFAKTALGFNLPIVSELIVKLSIIFLIIMIIVDSLMKPELDKNISIFKRILLLLEWIIQPFISFVLVLLPGIEAHTRLLFGQYLEYYLTKKK